MISLWLHLCLPRAPSSWPAEDSQPPTLPSHLRSFLLRAFWVEPLLPSYSKGQGFPPFLPRLSSQHLCWILVSLPGAAPSCFLGRVWSPHFRPASSFRRSTVLREGGGRDGACGGEPGDGRLLSLAPYPNRARCPASSGPQAHLFCALVTYESSPSLGPQPVPDTPWGPPVKLLALRGSCSAGPSALGQASGGQDHQSPPPPPPPHPYHGASRGHSPQASRAYTGHCLRKSLVMGHNARSYRQSVLSLETQRAHGFGLQQPGGGGRAGEKGLALWAQNFAVASLLLATLGLNCAEVGRGVPSQ